MADKAELEKAAVETNKSRSGVGTRVKVGSTRGKNPTPISWESFDDSQPATLPKSIKEFMDVTKTSDETKLVDYLIVGFNDAQYSAASDEIGEYVNPEWDDTTASQFRLVVRNYSRLTGTSIEDTVTLFKPGIEKAFASKKASA